MQEKQYQLLPFDYEGGKNVTERLCETLVEGEPFPNRQMTEEQLESLEEKYLIDIDVFKILNGELTKLRTLTFDKALLEEAAIESAIAIYDGDSTFIMYKSSQQAVAGTYLVDVDGRLSLNEIQRILGKKLAISFNGTTITVDEGDVKVVSRVALVISKSNL
ncbi:hypothetical protein [Vibrio mytili]|uniref:Bacteriophage CI repressor C-terminal domain-containing protein n=1 Tax=Vibrio mytili TaxID=50718 RepID=A0A0C3I6C6_9VIBR|nr:hypothetical protein [Vibrio mytili]KIN09897.1 hypothetical protein SU60_16235 [Vibrio mytili]